MTSLCQTPTTPPCSNQGDCTQIRRVRSDLLKRLQWSSIHSRSLKSLNNCGTGDSRLLARQYGRDGPAIPALQIRLWQRKSIQGHTQQRLRQVMAYHRTNISLAAMETLPLGAHIH